LATWCWTWKFKLELKLNLHIEFAIYACYAISLLMTAETYHVVTSCTQVELTQIGYWHDFFNVKRNFLTGLSPTESRLRNKCGSFSAIMWDVWNTQFQKQITTTAERAKITYAFYTMKHEGGRNIDFRQMSISTANNCKMAFSLHVVESASDDYNF